jgi:hypothetical protein
MCAALQYIDQASVRRATKDDRDVIEYLDYDLQDTVLDATLRQVYRMFKVRPCASPSPPMLHATPSCASVYLKALARACVRSTSGVYAYACLFANACVMA